LTNEEIGAAEALARDKFADPKWTAELA
jgi:hypothetical protein